MRSPYSKIKKTPFKVWHSRKPHIRHIYTFGSVVYYYNLGKLRKFIRDKMTKGILIGYKGNIIYCILKPNGHIAYNTTI
jgi:hypothetical protein